MDLKAAVREHLIDDLFFGDPGAALADDEDLFELGLDSMGITRLVVFLERQHRIVLPDTAVQPEAFRTLLTVVELAAAHR